MVKDLLTSLAWGTLLNTELLRNPGNSISEFQSLAFQLSVHLILRNLISAIPRYPHNLLSPEQSIWGILWDDSISPLTVKFDASHYALSTIVVTTPSASVTLTVAPACNPHGLHPFEIIPAVRASHGEACTRFPNPASGHAGTVQEIAPGVPPQAPSWQVIEPALGTVGEHTSVVEESPQVFT